MAALDSTLGIRVFVCVYMEHLDVLLYIMIADQSRESHVPILCLLCPGLTRKPVPHAVPAFRCCFL